MKKIIFCLIVNLFFLPFIVSASECSPSDKERLQKFANNVTITLEEKEYNNFKYFSVLATGVSDQLKIYSEKKYMYFFNSSEKQINEVYIGEYEVGNTYKFIVYGKDVCQFDKLRTITINIPEYNKFYKESVCVGAEEYSLCQKWNSVNMNKDEFYDNVNNYKKNKFSQDSIADNQQKDNIFWVIYKNYYWYMLFGLIIILGLLIYLWIRENKKNKI